MNPNETDPNKMAVRQLLDLLGFKSRDHDTDVRNALRELVEWRKSPYLEENSHAPK